jgi:hypothetical protein
MVMQNLKLYMKLARQILYFINKFFQKGGGISGGGGGGGGEDLIV